MEGVITTTKAVNETAESNLISKKTDAKCLWDKMQYAFCVLFATYFIGRCMVGWVFNV